MISPWRKTEKQKLLMFVFCWFTSKGENNKIKLLSLLSWWHSERITWRDDSISPIVSFLFADLSVGLLNVLTDIIWRITVTWEAGNLACKFIKFMQCLTTYASTYVLVALSIDRYDAITHPMNFSGSWKRAKILVISAWVLSALFSTPQFFLYEETLIQGERVKMLFNLLQPNFWL